MRQSTSRLRPSAPAYTMAAMHRPLKARTDRRRVEQPRCGGPARVLRAAPAPILLVLMAGALLSARIGALAAAALAAGMAYACAADPVRRTRRMPGSAQPSSITAANADLGTERTRQAPSSRCSLPRARLRSKTALASRLKP